MTAQRLIKLKIYLTIRKIAKLDIKQVFSLFLLYHFYIIVFMWFMVYFFA
jgi:hypothetical protein